MGGVGVPDLGKIPTFSRFFLGGGASLNYLYLHAYLLSYLLTSVQLRAPSQLVQWSCLVDWSCLVTLVGLVALVRLLYTPSGNRITNEKMKKKKTKLPQQSNGPLSRLQSTVYFHFPLPT